MERWECTLARIGILGATGFLGNAIYTHLSKCLQHDVVGFSRSSVKFRFYSYQDLSVLNDFNLIINCAGPSSELCSMNPSDAYNFYHTFQNQLLDHCLTNDIRFISLSTVHVYEFSSKVIDESSNFKEGDEYIKYRKSFESRMVEEGAGDTLLLRLGNCFGISDSESSQGRKLLINSIAYYFKKNQQYHITSLVDFYRCYVPICYLTKILDVLLMKNDFEFPVVNVVGKESMSASQIVDIFHNITKKYFIESHFEVQGNSQNISNTLCRQLVEYNDSYFLHEIRELCK
jgi:nucleoside-diphosphate-sugar epimerase